MLTALFGQAAVSKETPMGPQLRVPDITLTVGPTTRLIDVCIVNPTAERYQNNSSAETLPDGHAAAKAEHRKRVAYASSLAARQLAPDTLVPFAIEATGRLGTAAESFLASLSLLDPTGAREGFAEILDFHKARLRVITLRGNARAFSAYAPHLQTLQRHPNPAPQATSSQDGSTGT
jgi:hypothetical protein